MFTTDWMYATFLIEDQLTGNLKDDDDNETD